MKELSNYFDPIKSKFVSSFEISNGFIGSEISLKNFEGSKIALIGLSETRNAFEKVEPSDLQQVRRYLYQLSAFKNLNISDLGNLKTGKTVKDTYASIEFVSKYLMDKNIIPLFFGGTQDLSVPIFKVFQKEQPECVVIDSRFDSGSKHLHSKNFFKELAINNNSIISVAGYQSYFVSQKQLSEFESTGNWYYRLGLIRNNFSLIEPVLRDADMVSFDLSVIRQADCPASTFTSPNGLYNEEACQLANLSGLSDKLMSFHISEYDSSKDANGQSAHLIAQLMWHFIYGVSQRKGDYPVKSVASYKKIFVKIEKPDSELIFYQNPQNNRFWVEIPTKKNNVSKVIACSEKDYRATCMGEIPDRIWKNFSKQLD
ncbi:MAG: arginase family protein [Salinivirgaceae bacterium]|nr:arginase family protein [Salinivirgaceae bacterium]